MDILSQEQCFTVEIELQQITVNNIWVVPYPSLLYKTFNAHINIEICNSVVIKYLCKFINKASD